LIIRISNGLNIPCTLSFFNIEQLWAVGFLLLENEVKRAANGSVLESDIFMSYMYRDKTMASSYEYLLHRWTDFCSECSGEKNCRIQLL